MAKANTVQVNKQMIKVEGGITREMIISRKSHVGGFHLNSVNGACMCDNSCCMSTSGCCCRYCSGAGHVNCVRARLRDAR